MALDSDIWRVIREYKRRHPRARTILIDKFTPESGHTFDTGTEYARFAYGYSLATGYSFLFWRF